MIWLGFVHWLTLLEKENKMNMDQLTGILRAVLAAGGGLLVQKGWVDAQTVTAVVGGLVTVLVALWSWKSNTSGKTIA